MAKPTPGKILAEMLVDYHTKVPGIVAHHAIITPDCRKLRKGVLSSEVLAFDEAMNRVREEYMLVIHHRAHEDPFIVHLVLTVEDPADD